MKHEKDDMRHTAPKGPIADKKQWLFMLLFVIIAVISVWAIVSQSRDFSLTNFVDYIQHASLPWLIAAILSMICFILFEAFALLILCRAFNHKRSFWQGYSYSVSDIYVSAITPSATGGQPASAYFMIKDGMNGMMATALLVVNIMMYTLAIIVIGALCLIFRFDYFLQFSAVSKILIVAGFLIQVGLFIFFYMLLKKKELLHRICNACLGFLYKLRILRKREEKQKKLDAYMERYCKYSQIITGHRKALFGCFVFNLLQRIAQILVTVFVFAATTGESFLHSFELAFWQGYVVLGSNIIPVPGSIGISDFLMLDGFCNIMNRSQAVNLELLSRSFSFYACVILCGISMLISYLVIKRKEKRKC